MKKRCLSITILACFATLSGWALTKQDEETNTLPRDSINAAQVQLFKTNHIQYSQETAYNSATLGFTISKPFLTTKEQQEFQERLSVLEKKYQAKPRTMPHYNPQQHRDPFGAILKELTFLLKRKMTSNKSVQLQKTFHKLFELNRAQQGIEFNLQGVVLEELGVPNNDGTKRRLSHQEHLLIKKELEPFKKELERLLKELNK